MKNFDYSRDFLQFKDKLHSFVFRLLTNRQDAEDIVHDTFIKVQQNINSFKEESTFKTWVFTIALNLSKNYLNKQKRWHENAQDYGARLHQVNDEYALQMRKVFEQTPEKIYEIKEHIVYCFNCINKTLELHQQLCLLLKEVYSFKVSEIMHITGLTEGKVKHAIADARKNMIRIFDNRCSFVNRQGICHQCTALKMHMNPKHDAQMEAVRLKMVRDGYHADKEHLFTLRMELVKNIDPLRAPNTLLTTYMLENNEHWVATARDQKLLGNNGNDIVSGT